MSYSLYTLWRYLHTSAHTCSPNSTENFLCPNLQGCMLKCRSLTLKQDITSPPYSSHFSSYKVAFDRNEIVPWPGSLTHPGSNGKKLAKASRMRITFQLFIDQISWSPSQSSRKSCLTCFSNCNQIRRINISGWFFAEHKLHDKGTL